MLGWYEEARRLFVRSLQERVGRTKGYVGLARSHAALGNKEEASFFYQVVLDQLEEADGANRHVKEAREWMETGEVWEVKQYWSWPY